MITLESIKEHVKEGFEINPNQKIVDSIITRCNANDGKCPCHNTSEEQTCPCSNYRLYGHCCCTLYIKKNN